MPGLANVRDRLFLASFLLSLPSLQVAQSKIWEEILEEYVGNKYWFKISNSDVAIRSSLSEK